MSNNKLPKHEFATQAIRTGHHRTGEMEHSEPIFLTSSFVFESAAHAKEVFAGDTDGNIYSRFTNPTVKVFEERMAALEYGERAVATASGMGAILTASMAILKAGDHMIVSRNIFGTIVVLFEKYLAKFGVEMTFVDLTDMDAWQQAIQPNTKMLFLETPSNPLTQIVDITQMADLAHAHQAYLVVDNVVCTPYLQNPLTLGADLVVHSATKYIDGQGRAIGGVVVGSNTLIEEAFAFVRSGGVSMSPFNAWVFLKGLETLAVRMEAHTRNAYALAKWLQDFPKVKTVHYPWLLNHPQHEIAKQQQKAGGGILSFEVEGGTSGAWAVMDALEMISISANLGDCKTIITHPATTTHGRLSDEQKQQAGIKNGLIRLAVGLECIDDIKTDLSVGLS